MKSLQQGPKDERIPWSTVAEYTEQWTWPKGSLKIAHLFSEKAVRKHKKAACFMASASELLTLVPVFMCFFQRIGTRLRSHAGKIGSILLVLQVVWLLQSVRRGLVPPDLLMASILDHLNAFLTEYGEDPWKPKHHYSIHLAWMLAAKRQLVACFVTERKHRQIKRFTRLRQNTKSFEVGTAEDLTIQHLEDLEHADWTSALQNKRKPYKRQLGPLREAFPGVDDFEVARCAVCQGQRVHWGDVVYYEGERGRSCGEVLSHVQHAGREAYTIVSEWEPLAEDASSTWSAFRVPDPSSVVVVLTAQVGSPVIHSRTGDRVLVLPPFYGF